MDKNFDTSNPVLLETIDLLQEQDASVWSSVAENLGKVNRRRAEVNLSTIERVAEDGETVVVPGKVLGSGRLTKDVDVAAFKASNSAKNQINEDNEFMFIRDLVEENPEGENVRLVK